MLHMANRFAFRLTDGSWLVIYLSNAFERDCESETEIGCDIQTMSEREEGGGRAVRVVRMELNRLIRMVLNRSMD